MPQSLDVLKNLTKQSPLLDPNAFVELMRQREDAKQKLALQAQYPGTYATGATPMDADTETDPYTGAEAQKKQAGNEALTQLLDPHTAQFAAHEQATKEALAEKVAPAEAQAKGMLAVEQEKNRGALDAREAQTAATKELLGMAAGTGGAPGATSGGLAGPGGSIKPTINATGGVSFTTTAMPALVQRAHAQLTDARNKTIQALQEAERLYPGISDAAEKSDQSSTAPGWGSFLTGNAGKYGGMTDMAGAANDRLKYTFGIPTPFSNLAQSSSFGNIEQMAGQLPGVRGLATIVPLFKEHQSRWGHETPLATVQRLRHMAGIMDDTLKGIEEGPSAGGE